MTTLALAGIALVGIVILTPLADRMRVPQPVLLTIFGIVLPLLPGVPIVRVDPELILPLVLPPLLFAATQRATVRDFREKSREILLLAVGLTLVSGLVVAVVAHLMGLDWGPAFVLGAIVSPPDPVAATAVARRLRLPGGMVTVLEGEGMFNDATALVFYKVVVAAVVAGELSVGGVGESFVLAIVVGAGIGLAAGWLTTWALSKLHLAAPETTVTLAVPFIVYLGADRLEGSGVLAVLIMGLYLRTFSHTAVTSRGWLLGRAVWAYLDYFLTAAVFVFIGFELTAVLDDGPLDGSSVLLAAVVVLTLIATRFAWLFPAVWTSRWRRKRVPDAASPRSARETAVTAWAGMRGVVTVATALALPLATNSGDAFPERHLIVFVALVAVLVTLVLQGLTLAPVVRWLRVGGDSRVNDEVRDLRRRAMVAALDVIESDEVETPERVRQAVALQYEGYLAAHDALGTARHGKADDDDDPGDENAVEALLRRAAEAEREVVIHARHVGQVSPEAADEVLSEVEGRLVRGTE